MASRNVESGSLKLLKRCLIFLTLPSFAFSSLFYGATIIPLIIVVIMNLPWPSGFTDIEIYMKHSCRIILGLIMAPCFLGTVFRLSCRPQVRDTRIDDRSIIRLAKSRLIWFTVYMAFQNLVNFPGFGEQSSKKIELFLFFNFSVESILYLLLYSINSLLESPVLLGLFTDVTLLSSIADEFRGVGLTICTLLFVPVYRNAIFFCRRKEVVFLSPILDMSEKA